MNSHSRKRAPDSQTDQSEGQGTSSKTLDMILDSQDINSVDHNAIKGGTVGDTVYSTQWILRTLISVSKLYEGGWNESMENDMCMLWDMTVEKDVVHFLLENGFLKIAELNIRESKEVRLTEILVGIIGNMCCESTTLEALLSLDGLLSEILFLLSSDDTETVIQVLRIIHALTWHTKKKTLSLWTTKLKECEFVGEAIIFILNSSTNDDLLSACLDLVYLITEVSLDLGEKILEDLFEIDKLMFSLCEALMEFLGHNHNAQSEQYSKNLENWANIILNIMKKELLSFDGDQDKNYLKIMETLKKALEPYEVRGNLFPMEEKTALCIQQCIEIAFWFQKNEMTPDSNFVRVAVSIMRNLKTESDAQDCDNFVSGLFKFIKSYWIASIKVLSIDQVLNILENYDHNSIKVITDESSFESEDLKININKLLQTKLKL